MSENTLKSLQECKDEAVVECGFTSVDGMFNYQELQLYEFEQLIEKTAELYALQFKQSALHSEPYNVLVRTITARFDEELETPYQKALKKVKELEEALKYMLETHEASQFLSDSRGHAFGKAESVLKKYEPKNHSSGNPEFH